MKKYLIGVILALSLSGNSFGQIVTKHFESSNSSRVLNNSKRTNFNSTVINLPTVDMKQIQEQKINSISTLCRFGIPIDKSTHYLMAVGICATMEFIPMYR